ncbi:MAG: hypothetical protein ACHP79_09085, partial [Terriglobales bacterium]
MIAIEREPTSENIETVGMGHCPLVLGECVQGQTSERRHFLITAPIGLVLTPSVSMPALLGWLRPRILLPHSLPAAVFTEQLRGILLHEL